MIYEDHQNLESAYDKVLLKEDEQRRPEATVSLNRPRPEATVSLNRPRPDLHIPKLEPKEQISMLLKNKIDPSLYSQIIGLLEKL